MFLFWCYNKRTKIDKVYCLGLHHFTNENTICLCRKGIYELMVESSSTTMPLIDKLSRNTFCSFYDGVMFTSMDFNVKSSNFKGFLLVSYARFRKISYLCPRIKAFFAYCKIQKRAEVRSFPYCYLYNIGKRPTS